MITSFRPSKLQNIYIAGVDLRIFNAKSSAITPSSGHNQRQTEKQMEFNGSKKQLALNLSKYEATLDDKLVTLQFEKAQWHRK